MRARRHRLSDAGPAPRSIASTRDGRARPAMKLEGKIGADHRRRARHRPGIRRSLCCARVRRVAIADIDRRGPEDRRARSAAGAFAVQLDVTDHASIDAMVERGRRAAPAASTFWSTMPRCSTWRRSSRSPGQSYDRVFAVNVKGMLFTLQAVGPPDDRARQGRQDHQHGHPGRPPRRGAGRPSIAPPRRPSSASPSRRAST